jgi:hypothetical protein
LIEFLETEFSITVLDGEAVPENLDGIGRLARYVSNKVSAKP